MKISAIAIMWTFAAVLGSTPTQQPGKPVRSHGIGTSFRVPPPDLHEMIAQSDAVVRAKVIGSTPRDIPLLDSTQTRVATTVRLKLVDVLASNAGRSLGPDEITVVREGGERDRGPYIEQTVQTGFPPLDNGHEYILFLTWNSALDDWVPAWGPDSVWDLTNGRVDSPGHATVTKAHRGSTASDAIAAVRKATR